MVTFKKAKPAHKVNLYFPKGTVSVIGHTRFTTQGSEKQNYNNHPFEGNVKDFSFALAHNGVLFNDKVLRTKLNLPDTVIETDSYIAVQMLEQQGAVDEQSLKYVAETVARNFIFTVLRSDNTLFLVKGDNPLTVLHFPELKLYVYASTQGILTQALKAVRLLDKCEIISADDGDILEITPDGKAYVSQFEMAEPFFYPLYSRTRFSAYTDETDFYGDLLMLCNCYGVDESDVDALLQYGYTLDEIEDMLLDDDYLHEALEEIKTNQEAIR